jgi:hypothetical protein
MTNPLTPPPELVQQWFDDARNAWDEPQHYVATRAAQYGADQELEACCEWLVVGQWFSSDGECLKDLRAARRPKSSSLKEQALAELDLLSQRAYARNFAGFQAGTIRRAIEALPDD